MTLDSVARRGNAVVNDRGVTVDTSLCPTREKICQLQQDGKRANSRGVMPWTNAERILRGLVRDAFRCMKFKCQAQAAQQRSEGFLWHAAATTSQMLDEAVKYMGNGMLIDGKWRLCEDKVVMDGMLISKKIDNTTHDNVEFQTGFKMLGGGGDSRRMLRTATPPTASTCCELTHRQHHRPAALLGLGGGGGEGGGSGDSCRMLRTETQPTSSTCCELRHHQHHRHTAT